MTEPVVTDEDQGVVLRVRGLSVEYRGSRGVVSAVKDVGFSVRRGERLSIVGESGSGKTATCMAVSGLLAGHGVSITADELVFAGKPIRPQTTGRIPAGTPGITMVFQDAMTSLDPVWTVGEQMRAVIRPRMGRRTSRKDADAASEEWLARVGLLDSARIMGARPYEISGGMRQRVMLALALCTRPRLLIADEPTSALDAGLAREMMELMTAVTKDLGTALLLVTHDLGLCQEYSDRTLVMYGGRLVEQADSHRLVEVPAHPYTAALWAAIPSLEHAGDRLLASIAPPGATGVEVHALGCPFADRCSLVTAQCATMPPETEVAPAHVVRCWQRGGALVSSGATDRTSDEVRA